LHFDSNTGRLEITLPEAEEFPAMPYFGHHQPYRKPSFLCFIAQPPKGGLKSIIYLIIEVY
jgi:hypothetical protein